MYDPLHSGFEDTTPPWPTTPHPPSSPIPNLRRASPSPQSADKGPSPGLYGKEPQIYGQQSPGLVSPQTTLASNGTKFEKAEPYLRVRITGMDRNRRDILLKLDAQTNLSNFTGTTYRNISRSYYEFQQFYEAILRSTPQTIVPALPLPQTSAPTDEEDDRLVRIMLQRWLTRICEDPILLHDEEVRSFVESDFGYQPTPNVRRKASSGFSLIKRGVPDEDEELQRARFELTKLEGQFFDAARAIDKLARARKAVGVVHAEMGNKLLNVATTEAHPPLGNAVRKMGRTWHTVSDLDQAQSISECVILGDSLGYQGLNARSAKETLQQRTSVLEEYQAAVKIAISKRRNIERLKASSNIRPEKVDEALEEMEEANKYEQILAKRADGISQNLHRALDRHRRLVHEDVTAALVEHVRSSIMYERQLLRELETLRPDVNSAADKNVQKSNGVPHPTVILPLENVSVPKSRPPAAATAHGASTPASAPPFMSGTTTDSKPDPLPSQPSGVGHSQSSSLSSESSAHPDVPAQAANDPLLGGRPVNGTQSTSVKPPLSAPSASPPAAQDQRQQTRDPLTSSHPHAISRSYSVSVLEPSHASNGNMTKVGGLDPLGQARSTMMSASMRVQQQPSRPRLDAREAASKLANMF